MDNRYFNPRTHRGVRPVVLIGRTTRDIISIHAPIVGCDRIDNHYTDVCDEFQSTHPSWGATEEIGIPVLTPSFQSTHPSWGATESISMFVIASTISIHAPIVGCDPLLIQVPKSISSISIHAPIVGCDNIFIFFSNSVSIFQSTHPSWGATIIFA